MDLSEMQTRAAELEQQIANLPAGSVTKKTVRGKDYFYHQEASLKTLPSVLLLLEYPLKKFLI